MKGKEVLELLRITAPTLSRYVKKSLITVTTLGNGRYDYDDASVYAFLNKNVKRKVIGDGFISLFDKGAVSVPVRVNPLAKTWFNHF